MPEPITTVSACSSRARAFAPGATSVSIQSDWVFSSPAFISGQTAARRLRSGAKCTACLGSPRSPPMQPSDAGRVFLLVDQPCRKNTEEQEMADDLTKRAPGDRSRINLVEDYELQYWTKELGV